MSIETNYMPYELLLKGYNQCMDRIQDKINEVLGTEAKKKGDSPVTH